jgi:hypothetical protein
MDVWYAVIEGSPKRTRTKKELIDLGAIPEDIGYHNIDTADTFKLLDDSLSGHLSLKPDEDAMGYLDSAGRKPGWIHMSKEGTNLDDLF